MRDRRLSPDEAELWARVMASVRPLGRASGKPQFAQSVAAESLPADPVAVRAPVAPTTRPSSAVRTAVKGAAATVPAPANTLDGSWDRQIGRGAVVPDATLDLHGHTLQSAHAMLDAGLDRAIARGDRVLLLVTGRPPRPESQRPHARGAIRAAVADWLAGSRHVSRIAAVRGAHPRHGGAGALYIILRRSRERAIS